MKIHWHVPRKAKGAYPIPIWPEDWPVPEIGSTVVPAQGQTELYVKYVIYYPSGEDPGDDPFVYVVLSERR